MDRDELVLKIDGLSVTAELAPLMPAPPPPATPEWSVVMVIISEPSGNEHGVEESRFGVLESRSMSTLLLPPPLGTVYAENVRLTGHSPVSTHSMMCCKRIKMACS